MNELVGYNTEICVFTYHDEQLKILLLSDENQLCYVPYAQVRQGEDGRQAAYRLLQYQFQQSPDFIRHIAIFDLPNRYGTGWVISNVFYVIIQADSLADKVTNFIGLGNLASLNFKFDHNSIISKAIENIHKDLLETQVARYLLAECFTISELQKLLGQATTDKAITRTHFFTKIKNQKFIQPVVDSKSIQVVKKVPGSKRPAKLYKFTRHAEASSIYF